MQIYIEYVYQRQILMPKLEKFQPSIIKEGIKTTADGRIFALRQHIILYHYHQIMGLPLSALFSVLIAIITIFMSWDVFFIQHIVSSCHIYSVLYCLNLHGFFFSLTSYVKFSLNDQ